MSNEDFLLKLNAEQLLMRVIRYNKLVHLQAPEIIRASELQLILESLCKAVDATKAFPVESDKTNHKDFIKKPILKKWVKYNEEFFKNADEDTLDTIRYAVNESLTNRADEIYSIREFNKEQDELEELHSRRGVADIEKYKLKKMFKSIEI